MKGMGLPHRCKGYRKFFTFFPSASLQRDERANKEWTKLARAPRRCWTFWNQSQIFKEFGRWILTRNMWSYTCWTVPGTKPILTNSLQKKHSRLKIVAAIFSEDFCWERFCGEDCPRTFWGKVDNYFRHSGHRSLFTFFSSHPSLGIPFVVVYYSA